MSLVPHDLPDYVERGGRQVWRAPYTARGAHLFGFVLDADRDAIDALLHEALIEPAGGAVDYRCAHESVMITLTRIDRLGSGDSADKDRGFLSELEVAVWCLAADALAGDRLVWYLPYVFTDSGQTVATGREVYGYPKQIGLFPNAEGFPGALANAGGVEDVGALAIHPFARDTEAVPREMISVQRHADADDIVIGGTADVGFEILGELLDVFATELDVSEERPFGPSPEPSAEITAIDEPLPPREPGPGAWIRRLLDTPRGRGLQSDSQTLIANMVPSPTLVFLKQFRDVSCATKACYQAVVEAPLVVHAGGAGFSRLAADAFTVVVQDWDSHPIASDLGMQARAPITPRYAFHASFHFDILLGQEVWRAVT